MPFSGRQTAKGGWEGEGRGGELLSLFTYELPVPTSIPQEEK